MATISLVKQENVHIAMHHVQHAKMPLIIVIHVQLDIMMLVQRNATNATEIADHAHLRQEIAHHVTMDFIWMNQSINVLNATSHATDAQDQARMIVLIVLLDTFGKNIHNHANHVIKPVMNADQVLMYIVSDAHKDIIFTSTSIGMTQIVASHVQQDALNAHHQLHAQNVYQVTCLMIRDLAKDAQINVLNVMEQYSNAPSVLMDSVKQAGITTNTQFVKSALAIVNNVMIH